MTYSLLMQQIRDEQREEEKRLSPGERIQIACELSDACAILKQAARKTLEGKRAISKA